MPTDRRTFLQLLTTGALSATFPESIARALAIPANRKTGTIEDVEHIVILMQENRAFDHYFGTLRGVRGYGDPRAITLPSGKPVWYQADVSGNPVLPFHPSAPNLGLQFIEDLAHDWTSTHDAWNLGKYDQWVPQKTTTTMAHLTRSDIPFHYALADAFTICDAYHCSILSSTDPNRYYMWTGWVGNDGQGGGPVVDNAEAGYDWHTYPERLQAAGISWKVYQDIGEGLTAAGAWGWTSDNAYIGNYGDNSLLYFHQYQNAAAGTPLANGAKTGTDISKSGTLFDEFKQDVLSGNLPQVSWIAAPEAYTEHPNWPANYGAWYVSQILDALTANPEVWSKTVFLLTYDENDGFFDHVPPPTIPTSETQGKSNVETTNETFPGSSAYPAGPYGMGVRVPMLVISPWSKGGYVASEVFDHTSMIRFIEARFGPRNSALVEPNITPWRRAVAGDLTSALNFANPNDATVPLPSTVAYQPPDNDRHPDYHPVPPTDQAVPKQETGTRPARPVPYELQASVAVTKTGIDLRFDNTGRKAVVFQVYGNAGAATGPWNYTVDARKNLADTLAIASTAPQTYNLAVNGPNGFLRTFAGTLGSKQADLEVNALYDCNRNGLLIEIRNKAKESCRVRIHDAYAGDTISGVVGKEPFLHFWSLERWFGWYDLTVTAEGDASFSRRMAGHLETGRESVTDPKIAQQ